MLRLNPLPVSTPTIAAKIAAKIHIPGNVKANPIPKANPHPASVLQPLPHHKIAHKISPRPS